jgi:GT2 family glycosyltransferase
MRLLATARQIFQRHWRGQPRKVLRVWSEHGWKGLRLRFIDAIGHHRPIDQCYADWIELYDTLTESARRRLRTEMARWDAAPHISVLMLVENPDLRRLRAAVQSVCAQLYSHWELCICDDASTPAATREELQSIARQDRRIRLLLREPKADIRTSLNTALAAASGEFISLLDCNDLLSEQAFYWVAKELIENPAVDMIFSDEDRIAADGRRFEPYFKPDWNPALMLSRNAFGHLGVFRRSLLKKLGGFRLGFTHASQHDLVLRCAGETRPDRIRHIPRVLYHRREPAVGIETMGSVGDAGRRAIEQYLAGLGVHAVVTCSSERFYQVEYEVVSPVPRISILIPTTGAARLLEPCTQSIRKLTTYENFEVLLLVNERHRNAPGKVKLLDRLAATPRMRVLTYPDRPFNYSGVNNWGAGQASGDLLCFLNDDTTITTPSWLERLVARVLLPGVAAAGPMLFYPNDTIQHAGTILGLGGVAGHACHGQPRSNRGYFDRGCLEQDVSCVTAACMMIRRSVFQDLRGFDEQLPIAFNDVDLCVRIRAAGWRIIWTPTVELYHHESVSTGRHDSRARADQFAKDAALMRKRWGPVLDSDPCYNPNLSLRHQFHLAFPPRHQAIGRQ